MYQPIQSVSMFFVDYLGKTIHDHNLTKSNIYNYMMKLKSIIENTNSPKIKYLALDMDGVLCDFNSQFRKYLSNDILLMNILTRKKTISNKKLSDLGITKEEFIKRILEIRNRILKSDPTDIYEEFKQATKRELNFSMAWTIIAHGRETFWSTMDWMTGGKELVGYIKNTELKTFILTAGSISNSDACAVGKQQWLEKNGLGNLEFNIVSTGTEKYLYADENTLLIDDMKKNVDLFINAGGMGIVHINTPTTIEKLEKIISES
jgi:hypothetical protein